MPPAIRSVEQVHTAHRQREGGGFIVRRPFPSPGIETLDPFLMVDELGPVIYGPGEALGAPDHPHRGFETVSYILEGSTEHEDSRGNRCVLGPGDVQWMTAGDGIVHAEMPTREFLELGGRMHGFQIWVNLPASHKRMSPRYQEIPAERLPEASGPDGLSWVRVLAGEALGVSAAIETITPIHLHHWTLQPGGAVTSRIPAGMKVGIYVFEGNMRIGPEQTSCQEGQLAVLGDGESFQLAVSPDASGPSQALLLAGVPIGEPVAWYGPFVMNTHRELEEAVRDYQAGRLGLISR